MQKIGLCVPVWKTRGEQLICVKAAYRTIINRPLSFCVCVYVLVFYRIVCIYWHKWASGHGINNKSDKQWYNAILYAQYPSREVVSNGNYYSFFRFLFEFIDGKMHISFYLVFMNAFYRIGSDRRAVYHSEAMEDSKEGDREEKRKKVKNQFTIGIDQSSNYSQHRDFDIST